MKIMFLANAASVHTVRWVNALAEKGCDVHLVFNENHSPSNDNRINENVKLYSLKFSGTKAYYLNALQLFNLYKRIKPYVVNAHYASGYGTLARFARLKPLILSVWGSDVYDFPYQGKYKMKLVKQNLIYADKITSTSYCMAEQVSRLIGKELSESIAITPFGVDLNKFSPKNKFRENDNIYIGNIKTLTPKYGINDLIMAVRLLIDKLVEDNFKDIAHQIRLIIYGDGDQKQELMNLTKKNHLEDVVEFKGKIPNSEVPYALEQLEIFCCTSIEESFGVAVVEAMAMELPVVATNAEGFKEVVDNGKTGIIVSKRKPDEIAEALKMLVLDKELRRSMGINGRKRVAQYYDWNLNVEEMIKIYEKYSLR